MGVAQVCQLHFNMLVGRFYILNKNQNWTFLLHEFFFFPFFFARIFFLGIFPCMNFFLAFSPSPPSLFSWSVPYMSIFIVSFVHLLTLEVFSTIHILSFHYQHFKNSNGLYCFLFTWLFFSSSRLVLFNRKFGN